MKYCSKCDLRRPEDHLFCLQCGGKLIDKPKTNEEKIAMLKIILKETHTIIRQCTETKKQHGARSMELAFQCPDCLRTTFSSLKEISEMILNGNGKSDSS